MFINKHFNNSLVIILMIVAITLRGCHTMYQVRKTSPHQEAYHYIETKIGEVSHVFMLF